VKQNPANLPAEKVRPPMGALERVLLTIGLVAASPFIVVITLFAFACVVAISAMFFGTMHTYAPWLLLAVMAICLVPAIRDRMTGKYETDRLQKRIEILEAELAEAKKEILEFEEGIDFHRKLEETNRKTAARSLPTNVTISVRQVKTEKNTQT
jgi:hypothetical protein